ncbi:pseudouridine synthase [Chloroflexota bacterium]
MNKYLAFNKPYEVLTKFSDRSGRKTLKDFIPIKGVYAAGRLDYRSEGLLILSNDGPMIQRLTHPHYSHPKTYFAQVEGILTEEAITRLNNEILIPGVQTRLPRSMTMSDPVLPPRSKPVRNYHPTSWLKITMHEGKKHQVRRMTSAVGFPTLRLIRVSIGSIKLGSLDPGEWRILSNIEISQLKQDLGFG